MGTEIDKFLNADSLSDSDSLFPELQPDPVEPPAENESGDFVKGIKRGIDQTQALGYGLTSAVASGLKTIGIDPGQGFRDLALKGYRDNMDEAKENAPRIEKVEDIEGVGDFVDWAQGTLGELIPTIGTMLAGGGFGGLIGKAVAKKFITETEKKLIEKGIKNEVTKSALQNVAKATAAGQLLGSGAASIGMETGSIYGELQEMGEAEDADPNIDYDRPGVAFAGGTLAGVLDMLPVMSVAKKFGFGKALESDIVKELSQDAIGKRILKGAGKTALFEGSTEVIQTAIERASKKYVDDRVGLLDAEAKSEYLNAFAAGMVGGGAMGAISGIPTPNESLPAPEGMDIETGEVPPSVDNVRQKYKEALTAGVPRSELKSIASGNPNDTAAEYSAITALMDDYAKRPKAQLSGDYDIEPGYEDSPQPEIIKNTAAKDIKRQALPVTEGDTYERDLGEIQRNARELKQFESQEAKKQSAFDKHEKQTGKNRSIELNKLQSESKIPKHEYDLADNQAKIAQKAQEAAEQQEIKQKVDSAAGKFESQTTAMGEAFNKVLPKEETQEPKQEVTPESVQEPHQPEPVKYEVHDHGKSQIIVKGEPSAIRKVLRDNGSSLRGNINKKYGGIAFSNKDREKVEQALVGKVESITPEKKPQKNTKLPSEKQELTKDDFVPEKNQEYSPKKITFKDHGKAQFIVDGSYEEIRETLKAAGIKPKGLTSNKFEGLAFSKKHEEVIRKALGEEAKPETKEEVDSPVFQDGDFSVKETAPGLFQVVDEKAPDNFIRRYDDDRDAKKLARILNAERTNRDQLKARNWTFQHYSETQAVVDDKPTVDRTQEITDKHNILTEVRGFTSTWIDDYSVPSDIARQVASVNKDIDFAINNHKDDAGNLNQSLSTLHELLGDWQESSSAELDVAEQLGSLKGKIEGLIPELKSKPSKKTQFKPTHELPDGTKVIANQEDGQAIDGEWVDKNGDIIEDQNASAIGKSLDNKAHEAATSPHNDLPEPTQAQIEADNYKKGHVKVAGLDIAIENPKGSKRKGIDPNGKAWEVELKHHYGDLKKTEGADGDPVDVFLSDDAENENHPVFVVNQVDPKTKKFDEHKVMIGFPDEKSAKAGYLSNYEKDWQGIGSINKMPISEFKDWLKSDTSKPIETDNNTQKVSTGNVQTNVGDEVVYRRKGISILTTSDEGRYVVIADGGNGAIAEFSLVKGKAKKINIVKNKDHLSEVAKAAIFDFDGSKKQPDPEVERMQYLKDKQAKRLKNLKVDKSFGSDNKIVSNERADELRARIRAKLNNLNSGIDPELLADGTALAVYYIEAGVRSYADYSKRMLDDFGDKIKPYLRSFYEGSRYYPGLDTDGMTSAADIDATIEVDNKGNQDAKIQKLGNDRAKEAGSERGLEPEQPRNQTDSENLEAEQPKDVQGAGSEQPDFFSSEGNASENVGGAGRPGKRGGASNGRKGAGGKKLADAGAGSRNSNGSISKTDQPTDQPQIDHFHIENPLEIVGGGQVARFNKNKDAIELYHDLESSGRKPTPEDQKTLAGYTGWGSFGQELFQGNWAFPKPKEGWEKRDEWLRDHLGESEWSSAQRSITNSHYTDPPTVLAMWNMVKRMGFKGGRVLEPSMGIGNFFGMMPLELKNRSQLHGIELDELTGGMAKMLYPDANINIKGYQESKTPDNFYDVVIGNWPFENTEIADRRYSKIKPLLHDYFFLKAIDQVRPGGLVVGITSKGTMDKVNKSVRSAMAKKAELVASFRLPTGAFKEYAGTSVVTDIVILKKRDEPLSVLDDNIDWLESIPYKTPSGEEVKVNNHYINKPSHVIGEIDFGHGTTSYRPGLIVHRPSDMQKELKRVIDLVPENTYQNRKQGKHVKYITNHTDDRQGSLISKDGKFYVVHGEQLALASDIKSYKVKSESTNAKREDQLSQLIRLRRLYARLIQEERSGTDVAATKNRKALSKAYKAFIATHGSLNESFGLSYMKRVQDPFYITLAALEVNIGTKDKPKYSPAKILTSSTTRSLRKIKNPTIKDSYVLARNNAIIPTLSEIADISGKSQDEVKSELLKSGAVFEVAGDVVPSDIYLSGNVRQKLREAKELVKNGYPEMQHNIDSLKEVIPKDIPYHQIEARMGATWIPNHTYAEYIAHMLNLGNQDNIEISFTVGKWKVKFPAEYNSKSEARAGFGTERVKFNRLINAAMSNTTITIKFKDDKGNEHVDEAATKEVSEKITKIRDSFSEWLWSDPVRRVQLEESYNESRNSWANASYDGSFLELEGMALQLGSSPFNLRKHQVDAIWKAVVNRRSLNAHEVGTGKTFTMGGIAIESRRYGLAKKPLILAHNANSASVASEIQTMYPGAKILYIDNLSPVTINLKLRQIANDDWDAVVMPHSIIDRIALTEETLMGMAQEEINALEDEAREAADEDGVSLTPEMLSDESELVKLRSSTAKELVKARNKIIESIRKQGHRASREDAIPFEELGIDMIMVDESHEFKKPPIVTKMRMKGLNTGTSNRSIALHYLTRYVRSQNNGKNVHLFTGTPITNTLSEIYHQMRYIMEDEMAEQGLDYWDGWFGSFASEVSDVELNAAAQYESVTRLAAFINVPELRKMLGQYMDVVFSDDMPEMKPRETDTGKTIDNKSLTELELAELENGRTEGAQDRPYKKIIVENSDMTPDQQREFLTLQGYSQDWQNMTGKDRFEAMMRGAPESPIITEGLAAKASFDVRLLNGRELAGQEGKAPDHKDSKASRVVHNVMEIYNSHKKATQVIFTEIGISKRITRSIGATGNKSKETYPNFSTVHDIVERLVKEGMPKHQIAVIDGSTSKQKRKEIADKMNSAELRVVVGNSKTLGVGVNMQRNLRAMHHLDAPWMPGDLHQRNGRGHRQGNQWNTVLEYRYITDRLDGRRWQILAIKDRFIREFLKANNDNRVIEGDAAADEQSDILNTFAEAAGDPRILIKEKLKKNIERLQSKERTHSQAIAQAVQQANTLEYKLGENKNYISKATMASEVASNALEENTGDKFTAEIKGKTYDNRKDADQAISDIVRDEVRRGGEPVDIGTVMGINTLVSWSNLGNNPGITAVLPTSEGNISVYGNVASVASFTSALRRLEKDLNKRIDADEVDKQSLVRMKEVSKETFRDSDKLRNTQTQLSDLERDMSVNPVPPPTWLRTGSPVDTEVFWNKKQFIVNGHRWTNDGWFVVANDEKGEVSIPYDEVTDVQGIPLYEKKAFTAPEIIEHNKEDSPPDTPRLSKQNKPANSGFSVSRAQGIVSETINGWSNSPSIKVVQSVDDLPKYLGDYVKSVGAENEVEGLFAPRDKTIYLIANNLSDAKSIQRVIFHEALGHYGLREMFGNDVKPILNRVFMSYGKAGLKDIAARYALDLSNQSDRLIAAEEKLAEMAEKNEKPTVLNNIIKAIRDLIRKLGIDLKLSDSEIRVMLAVMRKAVTGVNPNIVSRDKSKNANNPLFSLKNDTVANGYEQHKATIAKHAKNIYSFPKDKRKALLSWMTERQLVETYRDDFQFQGKNPLIQYSDERQAMGAFVQRELHKVDATDAKWEELGKAESEKLSDVMLDATYYEIHPDQGYESIIDVDIAQKVITNIGKQINGLRAQVLLTPGGSFIGEGFGNMATRLKKLNRHLNSIVKDKKLDQPDTKALVENLRQQIEQLQEIVNSPHNKNTDRINQVKELEKKQMYFVKRVQLERERMSVYDKLVNQYNLLDDKAKKVYQEVKNAYTGQWAELLAALEDRIADAIQNSNVRSEAIAEIRIEFTKALGKGPYFPLARFGDYVVTATDSDGNYVREHAETEAEQEQLAHDLRQSKHINIKKFKQQDMKVDDFKASPGLMTDIYQILSDNGITSTGVMDDVYQVVLKTMPEMSYAKKAIHRKKTKGYSKDTRRAHAHTMFHGWNHISKIRYGHKLQKSLDDMQGMIDSYKAGEDSPINDKSANAAQDVTNHMIDRHELVMNPTSAPWTSKAGNIGFIWLLGASPAAGLVNLSQTAMVTFPLLAAKFGYMKAAKALFAAAADYAKSPFKATSHESWKSLSREGSSVTQEERQMILDRIADSTIDATQAHWVAQLADTDIRKSASGEMRSGTKKVMRYVSSMFHNAEVANREVSLLAAYRLAKSQGMSDPAKYAQKAVWDSHFDYSSQNRAQAMKNDFIKVATMMKNFSQHMIYAYFSRFIKSIKHEDKAIREQARRELIGITGMHALFAGSLGMAPFIGEIFVAMDMAMGDEDEPVNSKVDFQNWAHDTFGPVLGTAITKGVFNAVGIDIHSRINIDDLIMREDDRDKEGRNAATFYLEQIAGPMFGITANMWQGLSDVGNGEVWRGFEKMSPKFIKDWSKSVRYHTEDGVLSYNREPIVETLRMDELAFQFVGFAPSRVNAKYEARGAIKNMESKFKGRRGKLMNQYWIALKEHDHVERQAVLDEIRQFNLANKDNPQVTITFRDIRNSMKGKVRSSAQTKDGVYLSKRYQFLNDEGRFAQ